MTFFSSNPFVKILSFWLIGLLSGFFLPELKYLFLLSGLFFAVLALSKIKSKAYPYDVYSSVLLAHLVILIAFATVPKTNVLDRNEQQRYLATVLEYPSEKTNSYQCQLRITQSDSTYFDNQTVIAYFEKNKQASKLQPGDSIVAKSRLQSIQDQDIPFAFDYRGFMANRNIFFSTYIQRENFQLISTKGHESLKFKAEGFRRHLIGLLKQSIENDAALQVISALTLGYRKELSQETRAYFASTGAMHVLAVSGLHVGMIYLLLSFLLGFLKRFRYGKTLFILSIGLLLWFYALLTGFSPSVQRATVMFTFILIGSSLARPTSIYNSIAASAFLLLLFNPRLLFDVGFQLSYAAVISIVFFYSRIEKLVECKNKLTRKIWQLFSVSLAAQIGTFALSIYYFHQFPVFFWLSNFVVLPAAYLILGFTLLLFVSFPLNWLAGLFAHILQAITLATINALKLIELFPYSLINNITISPFQLVMLLACGLTLIFYIKLKRKVFFFSGICFYLFFLAGGATKKKQLFNQQKYIVYSKEHCLHLINGRKNYVIYPDEKTFKKPFHNDVVRELQLSKPIVLPLDTCMKYYSSDLVIDQQIILFLHQTFQLNTRKENQQDCDSNQSTESKNIVEDLKPFLKTEIDSVLAKSEILNLYNLPTTKTFITDLQKHIH